MKTTKVVLQTHTIKRTSLIENMKKHWNLYAFPIDFYMETPMYI